MSRPTFNIELGGNCARNSNQREGTRHGSKVSIHAGANEVDAVVVGDHECRQTIAERSFGASPNPSTFASDFMTMSLAQ